MIVNLNGNKLLMISSETFKDVRTLKGNDLPLQLRIERRRKKSGRKKKPRGVNVWSRINKGKLKQFKLQIVFCHDNCIIIVTKGDQP